MATRNIVPRANGEGSIGTAAKHWGAGHFDTLPNWQEYLAESTGYGIVSGCEPTISNLTVTVGAGIVHLADGTRKEIASTNITLDAADSTNPRIDLVYITSYGTVAKITGTAAASPVVPSVPANGISVAQVSVAAGATAGTVTDSRDYAITADKNNLTVGTLTADDVEVPDVKDTLRDLINSELSGSFLFAPSFQTSPNWFEHLSVSKNGLDFYKIKNYGAREDFTGHAVATDVSTIFFNGYFYQIYDYLAHPHPQWLIDAGHFLGGNGIQVRRTKDFKHFEFFDVPLSDTWLQTWTPEFYVDGNTVYVFLSLSDCQQTITENSYRDNAVEWVKHTYVMSTTDFVTWTTPTLVDLSAGLEKDSNNVTSEIDPCVIKVSGTYYLFVSDQYNGKITQFSSSSLTSGYTKLQIIGADEPTIYREAPAVIAYKDGYYMYTNSGTATHVHYTNDITKWYNYRPIAKAADVQMIHFTPMVISDATAKNIIVDTIVRTLENPFWHNINKKVSASLNYQTDKLVLYPNTLNLNTYSNIADMTYNSYVTGLMQNGDVCEFYNTVSSKTFTLSPEVATNVTANVVLSNIYDTLNKPLLLQKYNGKIIANINNASGPVIRSGEVDIPAFETANTGQTIVVNLGKDMPDANYSVSITGTSGGNHISVLKPAVIGRYKSTFNLYVWSTAVTTATKFLWTAIKS